MWRSWDCDRTAPNPAVIAVWAIALGSLLVATAPAEAAQEDEAQTTRDVRRISVSDRGIEIIHDGPDTLDRGRRSGKVRITRDGDTLSFERGVRIVGPAWVLEADGPDIVRVFSDITVPEGQRVEGDVVAVMGSVRVRGEVDHHVVAVMGSVKLDPGAVVGGDVVTIGGGLDQAPSAIVRGESVSIAFLPLVSWGLPTLGTVIAGVLVCWLLSLAVGVLWALLFPTRLLRIAMTASRRSGASFLLGLFSAPLMVIAMVLLLITVIGIPLAVLLPLLYVLAVWTGQLATAYVLGTRLLRRELGQGTPLVPLAAGTFFVALFFLLGAVLSIPDGAPRTLALFFNLLGLLLVTGLSIIGTGAVLLSRVGSRPRDVEYGGEVSSSFAAPSPQAPPPSAPALPPGS